MTKPNGAQVFALTRWFSDPKECDFWIGWFAERGVPAGIVSRSKDGTQYAVWRTGDKSDKISKDMRCDRSVNGFVDVFNLKKKEAEDGSSRRLTANGQR